MEIKECVAEEFNFSYAVKKEYYDQLKSKLSTYRKMDQYISSCIHHLSPTAANLPDDIIRVILLFFMYNVSKYEYISIFTVKISANETKGHLSTFNITDRSEYHKSHSLLQHQHRCDIDSSNSNLFKEIYGTSFRVFSLNRFPAYIRDNLFPKYTKLIGSDLNLHTLFRIESTWDIKAPMIASLIETDDQIYLSKGITSNILDRCDLIQSPIHGLIALGGKSSTVFVLEWNHETNEFEWNSNKIASMKVSRYNHRSVFLDGDERIFCCGGNSGSTSVEMYEFESNTWTEIKSMHVARDCHGCLYDNVNTKRVYALAAYDPYKSCEKYDFVKNDWFDLPPLNNTHRWHPPVKMLDNHNVLMIAGDFYKHDTGWGCCEYLDLRDSVNKWVVVDKYIPEALDFDPKINYRNKYMRGLWYLFM